MAVNPQSLAKQKESLYQQIREASKQQAQQQYQTGLSALRNQLAQQRVNMNQSRGQISEQSFMQQRNITNQAQAKGLGSSGLRNLAGFQVQQQAGQAVNQLSQQNAQIQSEAMNVRRGLMNELSSANRGADLTYAQQSTDAQDTLYQRELAEKQQNQSTIIQLLEMAQSGMGMEQILPFAQAMGISLDSPIADGQTLSDLLDSADPMAAYDELANMEIGTNMNNSGFENFMNATYNYASGPGLLSTLMKGIVEGDWSGAATAWNPIMAGGGVVPVSKDYEILGQTINTTSQEDAQQKIEAVLAGKYKEIASGKIKVNVKTDGYVEFKVGSKGYKTLGEALQALRAAATGTNTE